MKRWATRQVHGTRTAKQLLDVASDLNPSGKRKKAIQKALSILRHDSGIYGAIAGVGSMALELQHRLEGPQTAPDQDRPSNAGAEEIEVGGASIIEQRVEEGVAAPSSYPPQGRERGPVSTAENPGLGDREACPGDETRTDLVGEAERFKKLAEDEQRKRVRAEMKLSEVMEQLHNMRKEYEARLLEVHEKTNQDSSKCMVENMRPSGFESELSTMVTW